MERNEKHGVRLSTFDFTTDLKPLLGILSLYKQREEISNLCRNLHLAFEFPPLNSLELYFNAKFSSANSQIRFSFKYISWHGSFDRFPDFLFLFL